MNESSTPPASPPPRQGFIRRIWNFFWTPSARFSFAGLLVVGFVGGILFWGGFNWVLALTNTESFCISCHEMRKTPYEELKGTIHWQNRSGVRATCPDCHVPHDFIPKMIAKIMATKDLYHHFMGTYPTEEAFEAHRMVFAQRVWAKMKESDSLPCRNCHSQHSMDPTRQQATSHVMMLGLAKGATCIDCHKGVAHYLPTDPVATQTGAASGSGH